MRTSKFNVQECAAVNSSAPNFVGCSPFSLTTGGTSARPASTASTGASGSTLGGDLASIPTAYTNTRIGTASFGGNALLTGSCTVPVFAQVTETSGAVLQFPQVGCALNRGNCCPYDPSEFAGLTKCPSDYTTTAGACCPNGYSIYSTAIGAETPCYSKPSQTYLPASTTSDGQTTLITDTLFSRRYTLIKPAGEQFPKGAIAGIVIGVLVALATPPLIVLFIRRMKTKSANKSEGVEKDGAGATFPPIEPTLDANQQISEVAALSPQELASPDSGIQTPATYKGMPFQSPFVRSPPAYEAPASVPVEMPGSIFMNEHHPAYTGSQIELTPRTPPRSPPHSPSQTASTRSPVLSPSSPFRTDSPSNTNTFIVTPLGSPRFREDMT
ncbi:hypothetical protein LTR05_004213 [Lithohypha guttulata]|uniref:Uncharacterized protein n=1 Tax=Lithohypha guttulata TaxID=1690604 RepID=A0AAN7T347_9EURO|nr:hypothetical protein LTR05_004213 [Lithohypha guttulata]